MVPSAVKAFVTLRLMVCCYSLTGCLSCRRRIKDCRICKYMLKSLKSETKQSVEYQQLFSSCVTKEQTFERCPLSAFLNKELCQEATFKAVWLFTLLLLEIKILPNAWFAGYLYYNCEEFKSLSHFWRSALLKWSMRRYWYNWLLNL